MRYENGIQIPVYVYNSLKTFRLAHGFYLSLYGIIDIELIGWLIQIQSDIHQDFLNVYDAEGIEIYKGILYFFLIFNSKVKFQNLKE